MPALLHHLLVELRENFDEQADGRIACEVCDDTVNVPGVAECDAVGDQVLFRGEGLRESGDAVLGEALGGRKWAQSTGLAGRPVVTQRLSELAVKVMEVEALALALLDEISNGEPSAVAAAYHKLAGTVLCQDIARAAMEFGSPEALIRGTDVEFMWRQAILETIGGGTSEVMRGVIARQALQLESKL